MKHSQFFPSVVNSDSEVIKNIRRFNEEVFSFKKDKGNIAIATLVENISHYRAWYCLFDEESGKYLFAPSKYIGYKEMDAETYEKYNRSHLDGRKTEKTLAHWYELIDQRHQKYEELYNDLFLFCMQFGKTPNSLSRLNIVLEDQNELSLQESTVSLIFDVYQKLSQKHKDILKQKILRAK